MPDLKALADQIETAQPDAVAAFALEYGELTLWASPEQLRALVTFLRDDDACQFHNIISICGVDTPARAQRFDVVYQFLSLTKNQRIRVKVPTDETTPVPSLVDLFPGALWFERETYDMYGISFTGHTDLRRLLTDYNFEGYPLRKDFPLTGFTEVRYDDAQKRIVHEPVTLTQDFRDFDFLSPWEGTDYLMTSAADGKAKTP